ncbi:MAG: sterol desaturase family protein, partial [Bacteroidota bacterium]
MVTLLENFGLLPSWLLTSLFIYLRYLLLAGTAYLVFYHWRIGPTFFSKIQPAPPLTKRVKGELWESGITALVFAGVGLFIAWLRAHGWTKVYLDPLAYGWWYLPLSFLLLVLLHDAYFYLVHRQMHRIPSLRKIHAVHHGSHNPTPLAAHAFHPLEALVEVAILPVIVLILPVSHLVLILFSLWAIGWNIIGHLGYELFPPGWVQHPLGRYVNTSTHHNQHHQDGRYNFGLY